MSEEAPNKKQGIIDTRIPIVWFLSIAVPILWAAVQLYFTVGQLKETVVDLRATVHLLSTSNANAQKELAVMSYRIGNIERQYGLSGGFQK